MLNIKFLFKVKHLILDDAVSKLIRIRVSIWILSQNITDPSGSCSTTLKHCFVYCTVLYSVHCTVYTVLYSVQCTVYSVLYSVQCTINFLCNKQDLYICFYSYTVDEISGLSVAIVFLTTSLTRWHLCKMLNIECLS